MQTLLVQCWKHDPKDRPSFEVIFNMLKAADFRIIPDADHTRIRDFAHGIVVWEEKARASEGNHYC
jgi:hypothetical protein